MADDKPAAAKQPDEKAPAKKRTVPELHPDRLSLVEHAFNTWRVFIPHGTEPKDLETAAYWAHLSHRLRQHDMIRCIWEDGWGEATAHVLGSGHGWVKVHVPTRTIIEYPQFSPEALNEILPGHKVRYTNSFSKWCVERLADKRVLKDKCDTEGEAYTWLANYAKSLAA